MRVVVVYKEHSDHAREVNDYLRDYFKATGRELETLDPESPRGESFCKANDIVEYPTIIAVNDFGSMIQVWPGRPLPQISQISYYDQSY